MLGDAVVIVGAGIAGLMSAICLSKNGVPVQIFDSAKNFTPIGAGINLLPNATKALQDFGMLDRVASVSSSIESLQFITASGIEIHHERRGLLAGYDTPQLSIHRGVFHEVLLSTLKERYNLTVQMGCRFRSYEQSSKGGVSMIFETVSGQKKVKGRALIGCDGIHSAVRCQMFPTEGPAIESGVEMWRGVAVNTGLQFEGQMKLIGSLRDTKLVTYQLGSSCDNSYVNWVLERKKRSNSSCGQDWSELAKANDLLKVIANSEISCINLKCLIDNSSTILYYNVVDRDPLPYWTSGVVTLLGDAAHPMYPFGSNGACQAILDAVSLSSSLLNIESTSAALSEYEMQRREATSRVVLLNREMPPDSILEIVDDRLRDNPTVLPRDAITPNEISEISERYKQVTGFAVSQLSPERA